MTICENLIQFEIIRNKQTKELAMKMLNKTVCRDQKVLRFDGVFKMPSIVLKLSIMIPLVVLGMPLRAVSPDCLTIKYETHDSQIFEVPREIALQSETLNDLMEDVGLWGAETIALPETISNQPGALISNATFARMIQIMRAFNDHKNLKGRALYDAVQNNVGELQNPFLLLRGFNYLNYKLGIQLIARLIAGSDLLLNQAQAQLMSVDANTRAGLFKEVARYYFLLYGRDLPGIDQASYGFSIKEYLDYQPALIEKGRAGCKKSYFSHSRRNARIANSCITFEKYEDQ